MSERNPWRTIRILHRSFLLLELVFVVGAISLMRSTVMDRPGLTLFSFWFYLVPFAVLICAWPAPCPACKKSFLLFSFSNWGEAIILQFKSFFRPIKYLKAFLFPECPHCHLSIGEVSNANDQARPF